MVHVKCLRSIDDIAELSGQWDQLLEVSLNNSYSLAFDWIFTWVNIFLKDAPALCLAVYEDEKLIGIAPLWVKRKKRFGLPDLKILRFLGSEEVCGDHLDLIVHRRHSETACNAIWEHLYGPLRKEWDIWEYNYVSANSAVLHSLFRMSDRDNRCLGMVITGYTICIYVALPDSWDDFVTSLGKNSRGMLKSSTKLANEAGTLEFRVCDSADDIPAFFKTHIELHRASWKERGEKGSFATERFRQFHNRLAANLIARGDLFLCILELNGVPVGSSYGFVHNKVMYYYTLGVDRNAVPRASMGRIHLGYCIQGAIERGCSEFDMLRGWEEYKYSWSDLERRELLVTFYNRSIRALIYILGQFVNRFSKQVGKVVLGSKTETVKRWLGKGTRYTG